MEPKESTPEKPPKKPRNVKGAPIKKSAKAAEAETGKPSEPPAADVAMSEALADLIKRAKEATERIKEIENMEREARRPVRGERNLDDAPPAPPGPKPAGYSTKPVAWHKAQEELLQVLVDGGRHIYEVEKKTDFAEWRIYMTKFFSNIAPSSQLPLIFAEVKRRVEQSAETKSKKPKADLRATKTFDEYYELVKDTRVEFLEALSDFHLQAPPKSVDRMTREEFIEWAAGRIKMIIKDPDKVYDAFLAALYKRIFSGRPIHMTEGASVLPTMGCSSPQFSGVL